MAEPTQSRYLQYLPAIFQEQPSSDQEPYLGQFLLPFERALTELDDLLTIVDHNFAPALAAQDDFLPWLASWIALSLDEEWDVDRKRQLLSEAVELYRWRGTVHGLKRYLELYTGLPPDAIEIREACWPAGMQIGVASQIGGLTFGGVTPLVIERAARREPVEYYDHYVVTTAVEGQAPSGTAAEMQQIYWRADQVQGVKVDQSCVEIQPANTPSIRYEPATVQRRNELIDDLYTLTVGVEAKTQVAYRGDSLLVDVVELPYRFIVDIHGSEAEIDDLRQSEKWTKVCAMLDLEKPAHTRYALKLTPVTSKAPPQYMQIEVHSRIGLDTTVD